MTQIAYHGILFNISDEVEVTQKLKDSLETAAREHIEWPFVLEALPIGDLHCREADAEEIGLDVPTFRLSIDGIEARILLPGEKPARVTGKEIMAAMEAWTANAFVGPAPDGGHYIDFD